MKIKSIIITLELLMFLILLPINVSADFEDYVDYSQDITVCSYDTDTKKEKNEAIHVDMPLLGSDGSYSDEKTDYSLGEASVDPDELIAPSTIFGSDDRIRIYSTTRFPHCAIARLIIRWKNKTTSVGSGFLCGPNGLVTSAHCVYNREKLGWADSITAIFGYNNGAEPFGASGKYTAGKFYSTSGYTNENLKLYDYAVIKFYNNGYGNPGNQFGWFGLWNRGKSWKNFQTFVEGYPGSSSARNGCLLRGMGPILSDTGGTLKHQVDMESGQSGCPLYRRQTENGVYQWYATGINRSQNDSYNYAVRINAFNFSFLKKYVYSIW